MLSAESNSFILDDVFAYERYEHMCLSVFKSEVKPSDINAAQFSICI